MTGDDPDHCIHDICISAQVKTPFSRVYHLGRFAKDGDGSHQTFLISWLDPGFNRRARWQVDMHGVRFDPIQNFGNVRQRLSRVVQALHQHHFHPEFSMILLAKSHQSIDQPFERNFRMRAVDLAIQFSRARIEGG